MESASIKTAKKLPRKAIAKSKMPKRKRSQRRIRSTRKTRSTKRTKKTRKLPNGRGVMKMMKKSAVNARSDMFFLNATPGLICLGLIDSTIYYRSEKSYQLGRLDSKCWT